MDSNQVKIKYNPLLVKRVKYDDVQIKSALNRLAAIQVMPYEECFLSYQKKSRIVEVIYKEKNQLQDEIKNSKIDVNRQSTLQLEKDQLLKENAMLQHKMEEQNNKYTQTVHALNTKIKDLHEEIEVKKELIQDKFQNLQINSNAFFNQFKKLTLNFQQLYGFATDIIESEEVKEEKTDKKLLDPISGVVVQFNESNEISQRKIIVAACEYDGVNHFIKIFNVKGGGKNLVSFVDSQIGGQKNLFTTKLVGQIMSSSSNCRFTAIDICSSEGLIAYGTQSSELEVWDYRIGCRKYILPFHQALISDIRFIDKHTLVTNSEDGFMRLWCLQQKKVLCSKKLESPVLCSAVLHQIQPQSQTLYITGHENGTIKTFTIGDNEGQLQLLKEIKEVFGQQKISVTSMAMPHHLSPNYGHFAAILNNSKDQLSKKLLIINVDDPNPKVLSADDGKSGFINTQKFTKFTFGPDNLLIDDGFTILAGGDDGKVYSWLCTKQGKLSFLKKYETIHNSAIAYCFYDYEEDELVTADISGNYLIWNQFGDELKKCLAVYLN